MRYKDLGTHYLRAHITDHLDNSSITNPSLSAAVSSSSMAPPAHSVIIQGQTYTQLSRSTVGMLEEHARRQVVLRTGRQFNAIRSQNIEAWVCQERGRLPEAECDHCKNSFGPFTCCVVFPDYIHGSCANCHYGSLSSRCSIRKGISIRI